MADVCEFCGYDKHNKAARETILDYIEHVFVQDFIIGGASTQILLKSGLKISLGDCDVCNSRKVKYLLGGPGVFQLGDTNVL
jgi:hypothetical protein